jgi:Mlc titration factor MtfA (ptsG expression regulator)
VLRGRFPLYERLPAGQQARLRSHILWFVAEKRFEGCGGLEITDEIRVTVAAQACLLILHGSTDAYDSLKSILVYPSTYFSQTARHDGRSAVSEEPSARLGESWDHGAVVLAWDSVRHGAANPFDGHNVVFHEFAHQLDQEDGRADGAPVLGRDQSFLDRPALYSSWARVLSRKFELLQRRVRRGKRGVMDAYGATNPAEFFAVATESFFEKPRQLQQRHPKLYEELKRFYRLDPVNWREPSGS